MEAKTYQCNNTIMDGLYHYNLSEIISEEEYKTIPAKYHKWFTEVGKPLHFYCQNLCGDVDFSIDEWNTTFKQCLDMGLSEAKMNEILMPPPACKEQCFACIAIVGEQRGKTDKLTGVPDEDSPQRKWYLEWKANGKPKDKPFTYTVY